MPLPLRDIPARDVLGRMLPGVDVDAVIALLAILRVARDVSSSAETLFGHYGISDGKWSVLMLLASSPGGRLAPSALAARLAVARPTITGLVNGLERAGLVTRAAQPGDGRAIAIAIAPPGRRLVRDVVPALARRHAATMAALRSADCRTLIRLLGKIAVPADASGGRRPSRRAERLSREDSR